jgi:protein-S-isoprenylcysteine O-methyltransferase Ste14
MNVPAASSATTDRSTFDLRRLATGLLGASLYAGFALEHVTWFVRTGRPVGVGLAVTELLAAALFIGRRAAWRSSDRLGDWIVAFGGSFGALAARPGGAPWSAGDAVGLALQGVGLFVVFLSLARLGRSFGLVAAEREVVTGGPYRVVRHPLYAAYVLVQAGYLAQSPRAWNVVVFALVWTCQAARIRAEERFLARSSEYVEYARRTRFRVVPGVW